MSPRSFKYRKLLDPPKVKGFMPIGIENDENREEIFLLFEEYESLKLSDYDNYTHHQSSQLMQVSRSTFTRIYSKARQKIAKAFVEGKKIRIEGGKVYFDSNWYHCKKCKCYFNNPFKDEILTGCHLCKSDNFEQVEENNIPHIKNSENENKCICTNCGYEMEHILGTPCKDEICIKCNKPMKKK